MLTTATVRHHGHTDEPTAAHITNLWNAAYPTMRTIATARIDAYRRQLHDRVWDIDPTHPHADVLRAYTPTEPALRRRLKNTEELRRTLGQLDRGTHRACTQSPGGFNIHSAYTAVRALLNATGLNDHGLADIYRLAAALAEAAEERHRELAARTA
ncbi:hypothetical protein OHA71_06615 [Streptomyces sp. NBC_00444]|uniref:hypothetical protein n=1 Tax=Streptomyces sp. NBC_00444 TaxID=2975744 RepID=UPI002E20005F